MTMEVHVSTNRSWRAPIPFLDFVVDGVPLVEIVLGTGSERLPTRLQTEWELFNLEEQIDRMLGRQEPEYEDGRSAMYICRCGDLDCFAIGARIISDSEKITWTDWAWKDGFGLTDPIDELDALTFARSEYEHVLGDAARMLATIPDWKPPKQKLSGTGALMSKQASKRAWLRRSALSTSAVSSTSNPPLSYTSAGEIHMKSASLHCHYFWCLPGRELLDHVSGCGIDDHDCVARPGRIGNNVEVDV
ncbi:hypothetical protein [Arthrobacter sp. Soil736]|uniref:hypothetical protein n=1 Tax=Arthrobacter sp. Soil736 TaxID=1736395 RepID=UPI000ACDFC01|nr:hypothetical protein [Arthrobacter sp. Soil736]